MNPEKQVVEIACIESYQHVKDGGDGWSYTIMWEKEDGSLGRAHWEDVPYPQIGNLCVVESNGLFNVARYRELTLAEE